jgi:serine phosphatase RsbU (regulator of sigma subunit)
MAETRAYLRALTLTRGDVGDIITLVNRALVNDVANDHFVTLLLGQLDPSSNSFRYTNAGHTQGYILDSANEVKSVLESTGIPLGIDANSAFDTSPRIPLAPGDLVLLLTDGIVEARAPDGTAFGSERALDIMRLYRNDPAHQLVENLYHAVRAFSQHCSQDDDITVLVLKVEPVAAEAG